MNHTRSLARPLAAQPDTVTLRRFLMLLGAAAALAWSSHAFAQVPDASQMQLGTALQQQNQAMQDRANERSFEGQMQFQQNQLAAQQREMNVQRNFDMQRMGIINGRDGRR